MTNIFTSLSVWKIHSSLDTNDSMSAQLLQNEICNETIKSYKKNVNIHYRRHSITQLAIVSR